MCQDIGILKKQLNALQRELRRQRQDELLCGLTARGQLLCVAIYILSDYNLEIAAAFAQQAQECRKRIVHAQNIPEDWHDQIRAWFRDLPIERLFQLQDGKSDQDASIQTEAKKFIAKWKTANWVTEQNYNSGIAPTYGSVAEHFSVEMEEEHLHHLAERVLSSAHGRDGKDGVAGRHARAWCNRFCKRFALVRGRLATKAAIPREELEDKARQNRTCV